MAGHQFFGIDLGTKRVHVVSVDDQLNLGAVFVFDASQLDDLKGFLEGASVIAIDAPATLSTAPHLDDLTLPPKFRTARCAEIALAREHGIWVPWVTPTREQPLPGWMAKGFEVFELAKKVCPDVIEVYPHAGFRALAAGTLPSKQTAEGLRMRSMLLQSAGMEIHGLELWSHDSLDAAVAALTAHRKSQGTASAVGCGHDDSEIWIPS